MLRNSNLFDTSRSHSNSRRSDKVAELIDNFLDGSSLSHGSGPPSHNFSPNTNNKYSFPWNKSPSNTHDYARRNEEPANEASLLLGGPEMNLNDTQDLLRINTGGDVSSIDEDKWELSVQMGLYNEGSSVGLDEIIDEEEYERILEKIEAEQQGMFKPALFNPYAMKKKRQSEFVDSPYYTQYLQWKGKRDKKYPQQSSPIIPHSISGSDYGWGQSQQDLQMERDFLVMQTKVKQQKRNQQQSYQEMRSKLAAISREYQEKITQLTAEKPFMKPEPLPSSKKEFSIYRVDYPSVYIEQVKPEEKVSPAKKAQKQQNHIQKASVESYYTTFVDLIKNPPRKKETKIQAIDLPVPDLQQSMASQSSSRHPIRWKLDVDEILRIPAKEFLIFYNQFQKKLTALATPQQLRRLNRYRAEALEKEQSLKKLRQRLAGSKNHVIARLPSEKKKQLFELLYQEELEGQIEKLAMSY